MGSDVKNAAAMLLLHQNEFYKGRRNGDGFIDGWMAISMHQSIKI